MPKICYKYTTWRNEISKALKNSGESWKSVESHTLLEQELDARFYLGYGISEGMPFTVWTKNYVYFPACYDGFEWVAKVSRNPNLTPTSHIGYNAIL